MAFSVGSAVALVSMKKHGQVLEILSDGRFRVAVGSLTLVCREADLESVSHSRRAQRLERESATPPAATQAARLPGREADTRSLQSIDLHGMTVPEALAALPPFVDRAIRAGLSQVTIIHGISGGRLQAAVRGCLSGMTAVVCIEPDGRNPGATISYF
jgi:dsDNA-specific endonuclease/ATPase MutS2